MKRFGPQEREQLAARSAASARGRANLNWHAPESDGIQRFFNYLLPGTYVRPHRHIRQGRWELTLLLEGAVDLLRFDDRGRVLARERMAADGLRAVEVPSTLWHSYAVTGPHALLFEVKQGPYAAALDKVFADWAPAEGADEAEQVRRWLERAQVGERWRRPE